ncbi:MAG: hypothetical protein SH847_04780 [Roseiflexaceae bacterium]|nr:hypothetical protein [Roseiflexaceae bacterium]
MLYLVWYDESPKKTVVEKIGEAVAAYSARFPTVPANLVLVNPIDQVPYAGLVVRSERTVQPNNFWVGYQENT